MQEQWPGPPTLDARALGWLLFPNIYLAASLNETGKTRAFSVRRTRSGWHVYLCKAPLFFDHTNRPRGNFLFGSA